MAAPKKYKDAVQMQLRLPGELKSKLEAKAEEYGKSANHCVVDAIQIWLSPPTPEQQAEFRKAIEENIRATPDVDLPVLDRIMQAQAAYISEKGVQPVNLILGEAAWLELANGQYPPPGTIPECLGMDVKLGLPLPPNHVSVFGPIATDLEPAKPDQALVDGGGDPQAGMRLSPRAPVDSPWGHQLHLIQGLPRDAAGRVFASLLGARIKSLPDGFRNMLPSEKAAWLDANAPLGAA